MSGSSRIYTFFVLKEPAKPDRVLVWDTQDLSVGRGSDNDLSIELADVSRRHARFAKANGGCLVSNASQSNETLVNGREIRSQALKSRDVVRIGELELTFFAVAKNPATLGMPVEYASQLKEFGLPGRSGSDGDATILGLGEVPASGSEDDDFEVAPAGDFEYDLHDMSERRAPKTKPRNLDPELENVGLEDVVKPSAPRAWSLDEDSPAGVLSLHLEIEGLASEQRAALESLLGKIIKLPEMRIRLKSGDLD